MDAPISIRGDAGRMPASPSFRYERGFTAVQEDLEARRARARLAANERWSRVSRSPSTARAARRDRLSLRSKHYRRAAGETRQIAADFQKSARALKRIAEDLARIADEADSEVNGLDTAPAGGTGGA